MMISTNTAIAALSMLAEIIDPDDSRMIDSDSSLADLMIAYDLCPMHACDTQICADDDIAECATLRA